MFHARSYVPSATNVIEESPFYRADGKVLVVRDENEGSGASLIQFAGSQGFGSLPHGNATLNSDTEYARKGKSPHGQVDHVFVFGPEHPDAPIDVGLTSQ
jgi:hypothetical protein